MKTSYLNRGENSANDKGRGDEVLRVGRAQRDSTLAGDYDGRGNYACQHGQSVLEAEEQGEEEGHPRVEAEEGGCAGGFAHEGDIGAEEEGVVVVADKAIPGGLCENTERGGGGEGEGDALCGYGSDDTLRSPCNALGEGLLHGWGVGVSVHCLWFSDVTGRGSCERENRGGRGFIKGRRLPSFGSAFDATIMSIMIILLQGGIPRTMRGRIEASLPHTMHGAGADQ